jgi:DNA-binding transcriptional LysR family regulator
VNTELLRTFLEVARTRHFGHAGENLCLTQSAVSARIRQLEDLIGVAVFTRQRNNILLTPAGERLLPHAENLLASWQLAVQEVGAPSEQNRQLAIGGTPNLWDAFLLAVLPRLGQEFPHLYLRTEISQPQYLIRSLLGGRLDVVAMPDAPTNVDIASRRIGALELIMVCNRPRLPLQDVPAIGHVYVDWGTAPNLQQARLFAEPVAPILHTAQSHIALEYILGYQGAAYLPRALVAVHLERGELFEVRDAVEIHQDVHLLYFRDSDRAASLAPLIDALEAWGVEPVSGGRPPRTTGTAPR